MTVDWVAVTAEFPSPGLTDMVEALSNAGIVVVVLSPNAVTAARFCTNMIRSSVCDTSDSDGSLTVAIKRREHAYGGPALWVTRW